jgi:hypothetical protein
MKSRFLIPCLLAPLLFISCYYDGHGVVGAEFRLSKESRLPRWFQNNSRIPNKDLDVRVRRYESNKIRVIISKSGAFGKTLEDKFGTQRWHPESLKEAHPGLIQPCWFILKVDGIEEVVEQRERNDLIWIVEKPVQ